MAWSEFGKYVEAYNSAWPEKIANVDGADNSFDHVRIRIDEKVPEDAFAIMDDRITDSLDNGLYVIIAYKGNIAT